MEPQWAGENQLEERGKTTFIKESRRETKKKERNNRAEITSEENLLHPKERAFHNKSDNSSGSNK